MVHWKYHHVQYDRWKNTCKNKNKRRETHIAASQPDLNKDLAQWGTDQFLNVESIQRWASTFLNRWYVVEKWVDFVTIINQKSTSQPQFNQKQPSWKVKYQCWKMIEIRLKLGWFMVDFRLRSWFLVVCPLGDLHPIPSAYMKLIWSCDLGLTSQSCDVICRKDLYQ